MKHKIFFYLAAVIFINFGCSENNTELSVKPNILLILADDLGYSDLGCYGSEISTPNIDQLAQNGIRFTQFYNAARCCPTRASLLTGLYPHQAGMGGMVKVKKSSESGPYQGYLNENCVTLAEVLSLGGYKTYLSGKWHVGEFRPVFPVDRGFDHSYGLISGAMNYWNIEKGKLPGIERIFAEDTRIINSEVKNGFYSTTAYTDKALTYLEDHLESFNDQPFFLYLAYQAPHWPLHAPAETIEKYRGKYKFGWDKLRDNRFEKMKELGIIDSECKLSPTHDEVTPWDDLTDLQKDTMDLKMAIHAAMIEVMDENIGRLIDKLEEQGKLSNTLTIFLSDNGASSEYGSLGFNFRPDLKGPIGSEDSYYSYGLSWANASNTPYRKFKKYTFEGGFLTPMILSWGDQLKNEKSISNQIGHVMDIMPTLAEVAKVEYPNQYNGNKIQSTEGKSLLPYLMGMTDQIRAEDDYLFWEHEGNKAVRKGNWKLVFDVEDQNWKLFNLEKDRTEMFDVSTEFPEIVSTLENQYNKWAKRTGV